MVATGLTAAMPIAAFLRRDLPLFFEMFEGFKEGASSVAAGAIPLTAGGAIPLTDAPPLALDAATPAAAAVSEGGAASSNSTAASASPAGAAFAAALQGADAPIPTPAMDFVKVRAFENQRIICITSDVITETLSVSQSACLSVSPCLWVPVSLCLFA
jgi:hypothetical protein